MWVDGLKLTPCHIRRWRGGISLGCRRRCLEMYEPACERGWEELGGVQESGVCWLAVSEIFCDGNLCLHHVRNPCGRAMFVKSGEDKRK